MKNNKVIVKKKAKRVLSIVLLISVLFPTASCNKKIPEESNKRNSVISKDTPWFDGTIVDVDLGFEMNRPLMEMSPKLAGADEKYIVVFANGAYQVDDWGKITSNADFAIKNLSVVDRATKQTVKIIDLYDLFDRSDWPKAASYFNGKVVVNSEAWDPEKKKSVDREYTIDIETESITNVIDCDYKEFVELTGSYTVGDYKVDAMFYYYGNNNQSSYCPIRVHSPDGSMTEIALRESGKSYYPISVIFALDDTTALVPVPTKREYDFYKIDLESCKATKVNSEDYQWLTTNYLDNQFNGSDGKSYSTTNRGVCELDINNKTFELIFDYNYCSVNRQYLSNLEIADCSEDSFLLCGPYGSSDMFTSVFVNNYAIVEFKKTKNNPHIGKRIIELYTPDGYSNESIYSAIINYNDTNEKYFIELSDRYNRSSYLDYSDINSRDDYDLAHLNANAKLSDDLTLDLMNGEGPDILLDTSALGQLNNDNCLVDLSPYITDLDSDKYFTNIINGTRNNGKIYQLPISFTIEGIQTDPKYAGKTGIGFTTEEYREFLYETLNGKDVIESGQSLYFVKLFNGMSDRFMVNGNVDFTGSDFADIAGYVRDNVQQDSLPWDTIPDDNIEGLDFNFITQGNMTAYYCNCPGISGYLVKRAEIKNGTAILGIPSSDGRGPMFGTDISVAISTHAVNIDACVEFVKILLSDDVQNELVMSDKFVLNRDAFKKGCNAAIEYFNTEEGSQNLFDYAAGTYVTSHMKFTNEDIDNLENVILSCSKIDSADSAINAILIEEMPAYFLGQKDLDSVVVIIQDRAQKVLDERG